MESVIVTRLGNSTAIRPVPDGSGGHRYALDPGEKITTFQQPEGLGLDEMARAILSASAYHLAPDTSPDWVESDDPALEQVLASHWEASIGCPLDWGGPVQDRDMPTAEKIAHPQIVTDKALALTAKRGREFASELQEEM